MRTTVNRTHSERTPSAASRVLPSPDRAKGRLVQLSQLPPAAGNRSGVPPGPSASPVERSSGATGGSRLDGKRILVVEDEFLLADEIVDWLRLRGAEPIGPAATLPQGLRLIERGVDVDCAVLDINLAGTMVFPLALELQRRGVPLLFASAYAEDVIFPEELKQALRLNKPFSEAQLIKAVALALDAAD